MEEKYNKNRKLVKLFMSRLLQIENELELFLRNIKNDGLIVIDAELSKSLLPLREMTEILGIDTDDEKCSEMFNDAYFYIDDLESIETSVDKFMKKYKTKKDIDYIYVIC